MRYVFGQNSNSAISNSMHSFSKTASNWMWVRVTGESKCFFYYSFSIIMSSLLSR